MGSYLVQGGTTLYRVSYGGAPTAVSLPSGITLTGPTNPCRGAVFGSGSNPILLVVNGATHDFFIDTYGTARAFALGAPVSAPTLTPGIGTGLYGPFAVACTYKIKDGNGATIIESGLGPLSTYSPTLINASIRLDNIPVPTDTTITSRGIYRTTSGGNVLYPWFDLDNIVATTDDRSVTDAQLSLLLTTANTFSAPPDLSLITVWKDRLWGVPKNRVDAVRWTESRVFYAWNPANEAIIPPRNTDTTGVTAFIPRRDQLGIARSDRLHQITGDDNDSFARVEVSPTLGCVSQESVVVIRDTAYFLSDRGVVEWTSTHCGLVSEAQVDTWFTSDTYLNRAQFSKAQGRYNRDTDAYELLMCSAGSTTLDTWVAFDLQGRRWFGPHKAPAMTFTAVGMSTDRYNEWTTTPTTAYPSAHKSVFGTADGYLYYRDGANPNDGIAAVPFVVKLPFLSADPERVTYWGELTAHTRQESTGTLMITPIVGDLESSTGLTMKHDLRRGRERLTRLGNGRYCQLTLSHTGVNEPLRLYELFMPYTVKERR